MAGTGATKKVVHAQLLKSVAKVMSSCMDDCHSRTTGGLIESEFKSAAFLSQLQICCEPSLTVMVYDKLVVFQIYCYNQILCNVCKFQYFTTNDLLYRELNMLFSEGL